MPLLWLSLAFLSGLLLASLIGWTWPAWLGLAGFGLVALLAIRRLIPPGTRLAGLRRLAQGGPPLVLPPLLLLVALGAGAARYQANQDLVAAGSIARFNNAGPLRITGLVVEPPTQRDPSTTLLIQVSQVAPSGAGSPLTTTQPASGLIQVQASPLATIAYGDLVQVDGTLTPPSSETLTQTQGILSRMAFARITRLKSGQGSPFLTILYAFKQHALAVIEAIFPPPESDLMAGILLGDASGMPADLSQAFKASGTAHIVAISGYNISILAALFSYVFSRLLGTRKGAALTAIAIALYTLLVGAGASVLRAAIMAWIGLLGQQIGRRQAGVNSLAFTAALMCLISPTLPWDISFQLTFMATLGLVLYATPMQAAFNRLATRLLPQSTADRLAGPVGDYFLMTLAAQITTLPIMAYHFRSLSLVSLIANPLVLPPQPLVEIFGGIALLGGLLDLSLGRWLGYLAWPFAAYTDRMVMALGNLPNSAINLGPVSLTLVIFFYTFLFTLTLVKDKSTLVRQVASPVTGLVVVAGLTIVVWSQVLTRPDGQLHLTMIEAGATDSLLIQAPAGQRILINGGTGPAGLNQALGRRLPLVDRGLDLILITSTQQADLAGLPHAIENFPPQRVLWAVDPTASAASRQLSSDLSGLLTYSIQVGQAFDLGGGATLALLSVGDKQGATLLLQWGTFRALLATGWSASGKSTPQDAYASWQQPVNVLLMAGGGAAELNRPAHITLLHPQLILLSLPYHTQTNLPDDATLQAVQGYPLLRTDQNGWVEVSTDGKQMWVEAERSN